MNKICLFGRVSTQQQSLESQIQELRNEAERQGYRQEQQILIQMKESAVTLDTEERQGIRLLKEAIESDKSINAVVIYEISRLSRRPKVLYEVRDWLIERKVNLICIKPYMILLEPDGTISQTASILFSLFGSMAESEGYIRKERMSRGKRAKKAAGGYIGGMPLWGYKVDESGKVVIDKELAPIINKIYNMYINGASYASIGKWMIDQGIYKGCLNSAARQVGTVLSRGEYAGIYEFDTYPYAPIVTKEEYYKVKAMRADKHKNHARLKYVSLCKGLLFSKSGYSLSPNIAKKQYKLDLIDRTENMTVSYKIIDPFIWNKALEQHKQQANVGRKNRIEQLRELQLEVKQVVGRYMDIINDIDKQIDRVDRRIIEGKISEIKGDQILAELNDKRLKYSEERNTWARKGGKAALELDILSFGAVESYDPNEFNDKEKNDFVKQYIEKVIFEKTFEKRGHYKMTVIYKYSNSEEYYLWSSGPWNSIEKI